MEVKINREIRDYQESIFFGLNLRQLVFSVLAIGVAVGIYFGLNNIPRHGNCIVDVRSWRCSVCRIGLYPLQRHERGGVYRRIYQVRMAHAEAPVL